MIRSTHLAVAILLLGSTVVAAEWTAVKVPGDEHWNNQSEFGWYRCYVKVPDKWTNVKGRPLWVESLTLTLTHVAHASEAYVNGVKIGEAGMMPPKFADGIDEFNRFKIPAGLLVKGSWNTIAIRVYSNKKPGGFIGKAPFIAGYFLECTMAGEWEFRSGDDRTWATKAIETKPTRAAFDQFTEASNPLQRSATQHPGIRVAPDESLKKMLPADGLKIEQVLTEPIVGQPLHISFDERGRMWVVQYRQYPYPAGIKMVSRDRYYRSVFDRVPTAPPNHVRGNDRITIHEDTNGDGKFDKHKVFVDGLSITSAVERGRGGVWVLNPPYLLFYPDKNNDDKPDGDPVVHLRGFGLEDTHSVVNSIRWGPDGWLYAAQGSTVSAQVSVEGSKEKPVYSEASNIWRYHPEKRIYEIFARGGGNSFGLEIDTKGRVYSGHNGGNTRGFYYVQGGYYHKSTAPNKYGPLPNPYAFGYLPWMAHRPVPRFSHNFVRYEGGAIPQYRDDLLCVDPLHQFVVHATVHEKGSSFGTTDRGHALKSEDPVFRPVEIEVGPDGAVYIGDFCEQYIAHGQHYQGQIDVESGRVYRLSTTNAAPVYRFNLNRRSTDELIEVLNHENKWFRQTALRIIGDRKDKAIVPRLKRIIENTDSQLALDALWALNLTSPLDETYAVKLLAHKNPHVRAWTVRLMGDDRKVDPEFAHKLEELARDETEAIVRSQLACTARRLSPVDCMLIVRQLLEHAIDTEDPHIPLLIWWAIEVQCQNNRDVVIDMLDRDVWELNLFRKHILERLMRRFAAAGSRNDLVSCARLLAMAPTKEHKVLLLKGFQAGIAGRTVTGLPKVLAMELAKAGGGSLIIRLRIGEAGAIDEALAAITDSKTSETDRLNYIEFFGEVEAPKSIGVLIGVAVSKDVVSVRQAAFGALQRYRDATIADKTITAFATMSNQVRPAAIVMLASRANWSLQLLTAIKEGRIDKSHVSPDIAEQMKRHEDAGVTNLVESIYGERAVATKDEIKKKMDLYSRLLHGRVGNPYAGKKQFDATCAKCHTLFDRGGRIGPDLTPYQRHDTALMLQHIVNPSSDIREGFEFVTASTDDFRVVSGFMADQDDTLVVIRGLDGQNVTLQRDQIESIKGMGRSLMPDGLLDSMNEQQVRDLFAYLRQAQPVTRD